MKRWSNFWSGAPKQHDADGPNVKEEIGAASDTADDPGPRRFRLSDNQMQMLRYLALLLAIGIVLMSFSSRSPGDAGDDAARRAPIQPTVGLPGGSGPAHDYAQALEQQLEEALRRLHGVAVVHVSVTLAAGAEQVLAEQVTIERRISDGTGGEQVVTDLRTSRQPVLVRSDQARQEQPIVVMERAPVVQGVLVVTDAAADSRMRYEITRSVMTLLDLPAHRVYVLPQRW